MLPHKKNKPLGWEWDLPKDIYQPTEQWLKLNKPKWQRLTTAYDHTVSPDPPLFTTLGFE